MELNLEGKVVLVSGTGSQIGFGKAIVMTLAKEGCDIIANDIDIDGARKTAHDIEVLGRRAIAVKADISSSTEVNEMVNIAIEQFGRIDILVNNAGVSQPTRPFVESDETEWDMLYSINLKGVLNCTKAVLGHMIPRKSGKIVNVSAVGGLISTPNLAVYSATKAGVISFTKSLAVEVAPYGINVNSVAPGLAETNLGAGSNSQEFQEFIEMVKKNLPLGRITETQDIANAVAFLASDVSGDIIGQTLNVSGTV